MPKFLESIVCYMEDKGGSCPMTKDMTLQKHDVKLFKEWGYSDEHIPKIQKAIEVSTYELCEAEAPYNTVKFLTAAEAYKKLGHIEFLSGVARSTFSLSCTKNCATYKRHSVFFNSKSLYKVQ